MSVLERFPSYKESNKGNKQRQGPTPDRCPFYKGVRLTEVFVKRESTVLQISPLEETTIFTVIFLSLADVNTRKIFACINFGVRVDSWRQVKLL